MAFASKESLAGVGLVKSLQILLFLLLDDETRIR